MGAQLQTFPLSSGIKIVSVFQSRHDEIRRAIDVQKRDGQTDKKTQRF